MNKLKLLLFIILFFLYWYNKVLWINTNTYLSWNIYNFLQDNTYENNEKSISELNQHFKNFKVSDVLLKYKLEELKNEVNISSFLKENLTEKELIEIKIILNKYYETSDFLFNNILINSSNLDLIKDTKTLLLQNKRDFYKQLFYYINIKKETIYTDFVESDIIWLKNKTELLNSDIKNNILLNEKINLIKWKIIEHKKDLTKKLKIAINDKIDIIINDLEINSKFENLSKEDKKTFINNIINKINTKINDLDLIEDKTIILDTKIEIYNKIKNNLYKKLNKIDEN